MLEKTAWEEIPSRGESLFQLTERAHSGFARKTNQEAAKNVRWKSAEFIFLLLLLLGIFDAK